VACDRAGIDHVVALRVRVVPQRTYRLWGERIGELILLAIDESGWLSPVGLNNRGFLSGADRERPRVDMHDLSRGLHRRRCRSDGHARCGGFCRRLSTAGRAHRGVAGWPAD
jgi:hypothetical protein